MRFGVAPLTLNLFLDRVLKEKGLEGLLGFHFSDVIEGVAKAGYDHCEITMDTFQLFPIPINEEEIGKLQQIKKDYNITYSVHMPLLSLEIAGPNKFIRDGSVTALIDAYNSLLDLEKDIDMFVIHPSGDTVTDILEFIQDPEIRNIATDLFVNLSIQSIRNFIEETGIERKKIGIENIEFPLEGTIKIINKLGTRLCLDTAHLLGKFSGDYDLLEITEKYFDLIGEIHLQDYVENPLADHGALGTGKHFPLSFLHFINNKEYHGSCVFELKREEAFNSISYIKKNASEIEIPDIKNQSFY
ncbi:MAG: TIM barrel protein [Promethearchaeota archaeon]|jgi:sugar phosphate isomerase/epimerase